MKFTDVLKRYHISPLKYDDDRLLVEKDYFDLFKFLMKYFTMKMSYDEVHKLFEELSRKKEFTLKNLLLEISEEEMMDILTGQNTSIVVNENIIKDSKIDE